MAITTSGITPGQLASCDTAAIAPSQPEAAKAGTAAAPLASADDMTQQGLQEAQRSLTAEAMPEVDAENVGRMQTLLASPHFSIDTGALASSMLEFFKARGA